MLTEEISKNGNVLITGSAGFIGFYLSVNLLKQGINITGIDNLNNYYDVNLKQTRLNKLKEYDNFTFIQADISDNERMMEVFEKYRPNIVVNLAEQAGVRYSIENPDAYIYSNVIGFYDILKVYSLYALNHLLYELYIIMSCVYIFVTYYI